MCKSNCKVCKRLLFSESVTVVGTNLVVALPEFFNVSNCGRFCLVITQNIPDGATVNLPVVVTVGDDTATYPLVDCTGLQITAGMLSVRCRYPVVATTNGVSSAFKILKNLSNN